MNKTYTFLLIGFLIAVLYGIQQYVVVPSEPKHDEQKNKDKKDGFCGGCSKY